MGWLGGWNYRKSHVINPASGAGTLYQMRVVAHYGSGSDSGEHVYLNSHSRTDFGDVRFTDDDGVTLLDYWIESKVNSDNAVFWVEVADDLSSSSVTIYIYYGKSDETTTSNGANTFLMFDDFDNLNAWTKYGTGEAVCESGILRLNTRVGGSVKLVHGTTQRYGRMKSRWRDELWVEHGGDPYNIFNLGWNAIDYPPSDNNIVAFRQWQGYYTAKSGCVWVRENGSWGYGADAPIENWTTFHIGEWDWQASRVRNNAMGLGWATDFTDPTKIPDIFIAPTITLVGSAGAVQEQRFIDWIFVAKWIDPEPSHGVWGSEETGLWFIDGVTRDTYGNPLGGCTVWLFRTLDKVFVAETISGVDGSYHFETTSNDRYYFIRAYKDGTPNVFGTTDRNIQGIKQ